MKEKRSLNILVLLTCIAALVLPLVNTIGVGSLYTICASDIAVSYTIPMLLNLLYTVINILAAYAVAACVGYAIATKTSRLSVMLIAALSLPLTYFALTLVDAAFFGWDVISSSYVMMNVLNCGVELLRLGVIILAAFIFCKSTRGVRSVCPTVMFLWMTAFNIAETVSLVGGVGAPQSIFEVLELATPHIEATIYYVLGLLLTRLIVWAFERGKENKNEPYSTQSEA